MSSKTRKFLILIVENAEVQPSDCVQKKKGGKCVPFFGGGSAFHFGALGCHQNAKATRLNHQTRGICSFLAVFLILLAGSCAFCCLLAFWKLCIFALLYQPQYRWLLFHCFLYCIFSQSPQTCKQYMDGQLHR